jgi:hypothetical protein
MLAPVAFAFVAVDHPDAAGGPVEAVGEPDAGGETATVGQERGVEIRIRRTRQINNARIIVGSEDHLRLRGENLDGATFDNDLLLGIGEQGAGLERAKAEALDGGHHVLGLCEEGFAELFGPREIFVHPTNRVGVVDKGAHAVVPGMRVSLGGAVASLKEACGEDDLRGRGRRGKDEGEQRVGVEGDRTEE